MASKNSKKGPRATTRNRERARDYTQTHTHAHKATGPLISSAANPFWAWLGFDAPFDTLGLRAIAVGVRNNNTLQDDDDDDDDGARM